MVITYFESLAQKILNGELSGYFLTRNRKIKVESWYLRQNKTGGTIDEDIRTTDHAGFGNVERGGGPRNAPEDQGGRIRWP